MSTITKDNSVVQKIAVEELVDMTKPLTLGDAIRAGSRHTKQAFNWGRDGEACALTAACMAAVAWGFAD